MTFPHFFIPQIIPNSACFFPHQIFRKVHVVAIPHSTKYSWPQFTHIGIPVLPNILDLAFGGSAFQPHILHSGIQAYAQSEARPSPMSPMSPWRLRPFENSGAPGAGDSWVSPTICYWSRDFYPYVGLDFAVCWTGMCGTSVVSQSPNFGWRRAGTLSGWHSVNEM